MKNIQNLEMVLTRMVELLRYNIHDDWANALEKIREEIGPSPNATAIKILSLYGGMGSLNDLILYRNGQPLAAENIELDTLKSELYQLCHEIS